ncbi:nicotinamide-nucleotide amidohydrolase family protein [Auraticoccus sp. F435]|uniref:Nicotinamide-nucleotide amidohydrolase family protein n=1 Tax=Auraticoccus cholistanensis TaxID=2656650 RepID=A0A6A9URW7_9ACTN|nr:nicotinamide-nucleotide amidohydrolase family protein [Auraticoccus cholistanensis]MVA75656.1 nicotinamide-nucleotide amidohydrolase family protein [Auraticoccus cholistanensis]
MSRPVAAELVAELTGRGLTLATAESLTAGLVAATVAEVPGASAVLRGGVVAYAGELKAELLGVPVDVLARHGAVSQQTAAALAAGARQRLRADLGLGTTGVAGPDPAEGHPPGHVWIAVATADRVETRLLDLPGGRQEVRAATVVEVCRLALQVLAAPADGAAPTGTGEHTPSAGG